MNDPIFRFVNCCVWASVARCAVIVGITVVLPSLAEAKDLRAERVYKWDFQRDNDINFDLLPDDWKRRLDREHPSYIDMRIAPRSPEASLVALQAQGTLATWIHAWETGRWEANYIAETMPPDLAHLLDRTVLDNCLEITMDGGAAELVSPVFPMEHRFSYALQAELSCTALDGHTVWVELQLMDESQRVLQVLATDSLQGTVDWQRLSTKIATSPSPELRFGRIHVRVVPHSSTLLTGIARFDSISVYRMPRLSLTTELPFYVARPGEEFRVDCIATGIRAGDASVRFELRDHLDEILREESVALTRMAAPAFEEAPQDLPTEASEQHPAHSKALAGSGKSPHKVPHYVSSHLQRPALDGQAAWTLQLPEPGLYRVKVNLGIGGEQSQRRQILIGVMPKEPAQAAGPFGWSLAQVGDRLSANELLEMVSRFGAGWVKLPVWLDPSDPVATERLITLIERLQGLGIQVVGKLDQPPTSLRQYFGENVDRAYAVNTFRDSEVWEAALQPTLTRIGMKLNWFQLGDDDDCSFVGNSNLVETITTIRNKMQSYCQKLNLALSWSWNDASPDAAGAPWNAIHFGNSPQLTAAELETYVSQQAPDADLWVNLDPLNGDRYSLLDRVRDLTQRMVAVKRSPVAAAFVNDPLRPELRLFTPQKSVGEMLIPWHTLVSKLGAAKYEGSIEFPGKSVNHVFTTHHERGDETVMLLWNDQPTIEHIYLGDHLQASDVWGKSIAIATTLSEQAAPQQQLSIGPWPVFVQGVDLDIIRFEQKFQMQLDSLANALAVAREIPVALTNTFPQNAVGSVTVVCPTLLNSARSQSPIQLPSGLKMEKSLPVFLRPDASAGKHRLRFDFDLTAGKPYQFSIYRSVKLGQGDIELSWESTRTADDWLEMRVEVQNNTPDPVRFDCKLFPVGQPYVRFQIHESRPGTTIQDVRVKLNQVQPGTEAWLRCEQIGDGRLLNYRIPL